LRNSILFFAALMIAVATVIFWRDGTTDDQSDPLPAGRTDIVVGMQLEPPVLDPTINPAAAIAQVTHLNVFEGLTRIDEFGAVLPGLARAWEVSDDGLTYTFHLLEGVTFSDGTTFGSDDVAFTFSRNAEPDSTNSRKAYFTQMTDIATPDPATVIITLAEPSGLFLFNMAEAQSVIVAPETAAGNATAPVGTGPFSFDRWVPGDSVALVRNPLYRDTDAVALDRVVFRFVNDAAAQITALLAGDVDVFPRMSALESVGQFQADDRFQVLVGNTEGETILAMNNARAPLDNLVVRQAISHAIDRQAIIDGAEFGFGVPIGTHFAPHHPAYVDLTDQYAFDPDRARALLADAGFADGLDLTLQLPPVNYARRGGEIIASQLAQVGIRVEIIPVEWATWLEVVYAEANYDLSIVSHVEPLDISIYADPDYYFQYDSPEFRAIMAAANRATDTDDQYSQWRAAQHMLTDNAVNVYLFELAKVGVAKVGINGLWQNWPMFINDMAAVSWTND
jgi:peptide/nickel transport system substrate-binding protein